MNSQTSSPDGMRSRINSLESEVLWLEAANESLTLGHRKFKMASEEIFRRSQYAVDALVGKRYAALTEAKDDQMTELSDTILRLHEERDSLNSLLRKASRKVRRLTKAAEKVAKSKKKRPGRGRNFNRVGRRDEP